MADQELVKKIRDGTWTNPELQGADLSYADIQNIDLQGADLLAADLLSAKIQGANLKGANLQNANLQKANLRRANLTNTNLSISALQGANIRSAVLENANLQNANLSSADLYDAVMHKSKLSYATLHDTNLTGADLRSSDLRGASFLRANLEGTDLNFAETDDQTRIDLPANFQLIDNIIRRIDRSHATSNVINSIDKKSQFSELSTANENNLKQGNYSEESTSLIDIITALGRKISFFGQPDGHHVCSSNIGIGGGLLSITATFIPYKGNSGRDYKSFLELLGWDEANDLRIEEEALQNILSAIHETLSKYGMDISRDDPFFEQLINESWITFSASPLSCGPLPNDISVAVKHPKKKGLIALICGKGVLIISVGTFVAGAIFGSISGDMGKGFFGAAFGVESWEEKGEEIFHSLQATYEESQLTILNVLSRTAPEKSPPSSEGETPLALHRDEEDGPRDEEDEA
ncbi:MAG: hypothetical protein CMN56_00340 [Sneathiella sp.]|uniref:pentapeptide repeat-containing protein n=1 Tax=Sneathiella sp. TaxID=1964365 RepID=UPI000C354998|nr:pentapeptide repeat-containing protein [Sneathiella sp.]MAZ01568.1 hypothetical protein [Sneathiella sp.]